MNCVGGMGVLLPLLDQVAAERKESEDSQETHDLVGPELTSSRSRQGMLIPLSKSSGERSIGLAIAGKAWEGGSGRPAPPHAAGALKFAWAMYLPVSWAASPTPPLGNKSWSLADPSHPLLQRADWRIMAWLHFCCWSRTLSSITP